MKKLSLVVLAGAMAFLLSSCFALQSFSLLAGALKPGESTKAVFVVRPFSSATTPPISHVGHQFVLIGVNNSDDVLATKATWNVKKNKLFAPMQNMPVSGAVAGAIGTQCDMSGFTYSTITGFTWKGFITLNAVNDKRLVGQTVVIQVGLKAKVAAAHHDNVSVIGLTGEWQDTSGDGIVNGGDSFFCSGNGSSFLFIK
jgi:hypothetical protein